LQVPASGSRSRSLSFSLALAFVLALALDLSRARTSARRSLSPFSSLPLSRSLPALSLALAVTLAPALALAVCDSVLLWFQYVVVFYVRMNSLTELVTYFPQSRRLMSSVCWCHLPFCPPPPGKDANSVDLFQDILKYGVDHHDVPDSCPWHGVRVCRKNRRNTCPKMVDTFTISWILCCHRRSVMSWPIVVISTPPDIPSRSSWRTRPKDLSLGVWSHSLKWMVYNPRSMTTHGTVSHGGHVWAKRAWRALRFRIVWWNAATWIRDRPSNSWYQTQQWST